MRRTVNSGVSIRRSRVWSGGSNSSICPARRAAASLASPPAMSCRAPARALLNRRQSPSTARTSSNRVTSHASSPYGIRTRRTPSPSRMAARSGAGSNSSRRMYSGISVVATASSSVVCPEVK